ncbi:MAG TPA: ABC transporter ATP-binding protein [Candidatus Dormibacteraeota bacterium]|nr:ABC transporter ATP-binding protein [Candidatus Dormibacteraeota bacterium]
MARVTANGRGDAAPRAAVVELVSVYKAFVAGGTRQAKLALEDVSLSVPRGEFWSIIGPSGCGKSTILNLIAGLSAPTDGTVLYDGRVVRGVNTDVGYVTQDDNLLPWRTLQANVELALELRGVPAAQRAERSRELIGRVGLSGFERHYPAELSGGMRKRASIIRTLIYETPVILMDEPFGPLDAQTRLVLQDDLLRLWERSRRTILFVTHDLVEAIALSDRVVVMSAAPGRIKRVYDVGIPRPRDVFHIHGAPGFSLVYDRLWADISDEIAVSRRRRAGDAVEAPEAVES